jgi:hypothetical protein
MSADGSVTLAWAGEERKFRLAIGQLRELQENVNRWRVNIGAAPIGPSSLLRLLMGGDAWPDEVREIVRLGLIGGGEVGIALVPGLIKRYVDDRPLVESTQVAQAVLLSAMVGVPDDPVGKKPKRRRKTQATSSASPASTEPGCAIGFAPDQIDRMSLWQFAACVDGFNRANGAESEPDAMNPSEFDDLLARNQKFMTVH